MTLVRTNQGVSWIKWLLFYVAARLFDALWRINAPKADIELFLTSAFKDIYQSQEASFVPLQETPSSFESLHWHTFGFETKEEYEFWCVRLCGIACLKIVLNYFQIDLGANIATITKWCRLHGGYDVIADRGWTHRSLTAYLGHKGLKVSLGRLILWSMIIHNFRQNNVLIVSIKEGKGVNPLIGDGHLIVLVGASEASGERWVHYLDPAKPEKPFMNQASSMTWSDFLRLYRLRFIKVSNNN
ncbi:MAG: hypothetical protein A3E37_05365 [Candidatus Andersenbacteria bacterium RIFCSPHIGHO2_12_FULL_46_9]|nr:MAG: hypothetical protein UW94_C0002G0017 [Parcubacteria group bacterium GW2011_GWA2_45_14]OGY33554.1 MAG: hypothetical protein A3B76_05900 [Candidatus Andersenbacteria bacterium RIFCSPHIGHO2_02_FULL_46_16]OGY35681.1 MAG: hypothetical protein A3E37_05365 [Candidatus Andersenbacteria bacterium RIFCSPHIGHO2_12_FULL_46_9]OGY38311.1 MAG: hypothetical protein A3I08_03420 [Candidatus Andersenbacteria bacterium RIFCSPLOWO2_02_FULL_46_11]HBE89963.1 hypothetical protein [Candidatus Andersenbacteria b